MAIKKCSEFIPSFWQLMHELHILEEWLSGIQHYSFLGKEGVQIIDHFVLLLE